ncbi:unnamed protein product [Mycena citricolor]|uniref:Tc1-like transposase DDE domain-containing protein n=1 Tax=Mycena citricolor TaxID=2018698 RepID=A0AAD2H327_9AGAR|nr:unnamed protein product [Mycena citricolor]
MAPNLSPTKKAKIVEWTRDGRSHKWIREHLTGRHDISDSTIYWIQRDYSEKENYYDVGHSPGRPRKLQARDMRKAVRSLGNQTVTNATELKDAFFPDVSVKTIKRNLRIAGLEAHIRRPIPFISALNLKRRKEWGESHVHWQVEDWKRVLFSDESIFRLFGSDGIEWCWRKPSERLDPRFTKKRVKHGGGKITVWGMITPHGLGRLVRIDGNLNKELYREILKDDLLGTLDDLDLDPRDYIFQQDNDPKHTARIVTTWFAENHIAVLPWPASSPDMNIIEHVWSHLDKKVRKRKPLPSNVEQLWTALQEEWARIDEGYIESLYDSMPRRIRALIAAKGGNTSY